MDHVDTILAQWRQERPDLDVAPMGLIGRLKQLHTHLMGELERVYKAHDLNAASFDVLATLRRAGAPYALSPSQLIDSTMVTSGTMTNRIDRLESAGWVKRQKNPDDGRGFVIALTDEGLSLINRVIDAHVANQHRLVAHLSADTRAHLDEGLTVWLRGLKEG